jgi:hypothetical protein
MEYAVVLSLVATVFMNMNTYIKRGIQGRLKDMSDNFISAQQVSEINTGEFSSESATVDRAAMRKKVARGGAAGVALREERQINAYSSSITSDNSEHTALTQASDAEASVRAELDIQSIGTENATINAESRFIEPDWENARDLASYRRAYESYLRRIAYCDDSVRRFESEANGLMAIYYDVHCSGKRKKECRQRMRIVYDQAQDLYQKAADMRAEAAIYRGKLELIRRKIEELERAG